MEIQESVLEQENASGYRESNSDLSCSSDQDIMNKIREDGLEYEEEMEEIIENEKCGGRHMAMVRLCPAYQKERRLRELMAEYNCTYRRALAIYVPNTNEDDPQSINELTHLPENIIDIPYYTQSTSYVPLQQPTYAEVVVHKDARKKQSKTVPPNTKKAKRGTLEESGDFGTHPEINSAFPGENAEESVKSKSSVNFSELLSRLKDILFLKGTSVAMKVKSVVKCCVEWLVLVVVENISDWSMLKIILEYFGFDT
ncbi:hypothetical protein K1T71_008278 [Dendrolimus kikuchii]|uniref:Uncharacterized protein n=1 Tax=Dendrolimus kikuchii TaxID=765133 RepID=A0ACC1CWP3_9NEOP|nr:hypothetical protein K1T71_008278 [Dendrolimus kikuchii]